MPLFFGRFHLIMTYRPGSKNAKPDALFCMHGKEDSTTISPELIHPSILLVWSQGWPWKLKRKLKQPSFSGLICPNIMPPGLKQTVAFLKQCFWWLSIEEEATFLCQICAQKKSSNSLMLVYYSLCLSCHGLFLNFVTGLPASAAKNCCLHPCRLLLVIVSNFL